MSLDEFANEWATELLFTIDVETRLILDATGDVEACLGLRPEQLVGLPLFAAVHHDDLEAAEGAFVEVVREGHATWEGRVQRLDGVFVRYGWEGRLGLRGDTIYARSRDLDVVREQQAKVRVFERLAEQTVDLLFVVDGEGRIIQANRSVADAHNVPEDEVIGSRLVDFVPPEGHRVLLEMPERLAAGEHVIDFRIPAYNGRGGVMTMEGSATFDPLTSRWYVVERDVTERVARERELEITQRFFDLSASQLVLVDVDDVIVRANPAFLAMLGVTVDDVVGRDVLEVLRVVGGPDVRSLIATARAGRSVTIEEARVLVGGSFRVIEVHLSSSSEGTGVYLSCRDVTSELELQVELERRATSDPLTGLANRASLSDELQADLESGTLVSVVMLDLDGFKRINDSLGHAAGDALLKGIGQRLQHVTRGVDLVARMGGDEFVVLLRGIPDVATLGIVAEKIRACFQVPFEVLGRPVSITASIGVTCGTELTHTGEELLHEADLAAYAAKRSGENRTRMFDDALREESDFQNAVEEHLRRVLEAPDFDLEVVELSDSSGRTIGLGVVAPSIAASGQRRWNDKALGAAIDLGLIGPLSNRVADEAVRQLEPWLCDHPDAFLDLVLTVDEVALNGFVPMFLGLLNSSSIDPRQLMISISGLDVANVDRVDRADIDQLRSAGVQIGLAEADADAATLAAITAIGLDRIEVNAIRLAALDDNSVDRLIADAVFEAAERLGIQVVVDAAFTPDMVDMARLLAGCDSIGVRAAAPVSIARFIGQTDPTDQTDQTDQSGQVSGVA